MKTIMSLVLIGLMAWSCDKGIDPAVEIFELHSDSEITKEEVQPGLFLHRRVAGTGLVAVYNYVGPQSDEVYDDEYGELLTFELPTDNNQFSYSNEELADLKAFFKQYGAWVSHNTIDVVTGSISGSRLIGEFSSVWRVEIDIEVEKGGKVYTIKTAGTLEPQ